ncbi:hypothetical protein EJB05_14567, partial [Eragrostis curvula]
MEPSMGSASDKASTNCSSSPPVVDGNAQLVAMIRQMVREEVQLQSQQLAYSFMAAATRAKGDNSSHNRVNTVRTCELDHYCLAGGSSRSTVSFASSSPPTLYSCAGGAAVTDKLNQEQFRPAKMDDGHKQAIGAGRMTF